MADPTKESQQERNANRKLETIGDIQRALVRLALRVERVKNPNLEKVNALRALYQAIHSVMQDRRDSRYKARLKVLWAVYEKQTAVKPPQPTEMNQH